ncbi:MAG TPA: pyridoxal-phosphate dependent enzyme [Gaiellaceae bacterium]|nr:pyridoxal-phosphate dependent enzyme [Gaiellaceae bacterium]
MTPADVLRASAAIGNRLHRTPLFTSKTLGHAARARVYLKAELFQKTGSFKPRGLLAKLTSLSPEERRRGVITVSAGNAAAALAYGAALEAIDCLVVMWRGASEAKIAAVRAFGAAVDLEAAGPEEAFDRVADVTARTGRTFIHPFDDDVVIAGHGSLGLEIVEDRPDVETVVVPVGGGGLISGIAVAVKATRPHARVVGVEPDGSAALGKALAAGQPVRIVPRSIADGLNAPFAGERCFAVCRDLVDDAITVSEDEIAAGFRFLYTRAKLAAEPAGAAAVAAVLAGKIPEMNASTVAVVVSGGNVAARTASAILASDEA